MSEFRAARSAMKASLIKRMKGKGLTEAKAAALASIAIDSIWEEYGGQRVYFPKGRNVKADPEQVWESFTGRNYEELSTLFGVSVRRVQQIIAKRTAPLRHSQGLVSPAVSKS